MNDLLKRWPPFSTLPSTSLPGPPATLSKCMNCVARPWEVAANRLNKPNRPHAPQSHLKVASQHAATQKSKLDQPFLRLTPCSCEFWRDMWDHDMAAMLSSSILTRGAGWHCRDSCATCADAPTALCSCQSPTRGPWYSQPSAQPGNGPSHLKGNFWIYNANQFPYISIRGLRWQQWAL